MTQRSTRKRTKAPRRHTLVIRLNDREWQAIEDYCKMVKAESRAALLRRIIMTNIIEHWEDETPMLFKDDEMR